MKPDNHKRCLRIEFLYNDAESYACILRSLQKCTTAKNI